MTNEHIDAVLEYARRKRAKGFTKEEALRSLQAAGILDENGDFTTPYQILGEWLLSNKQPNEKGEVKLFS